GLTTISLASYPPLITEPPAKTCSPSDSALVADFWPPWRITVLLSRTQVQVVPSLACTTTLLPLTDSITPRSNAIVRGPVLVSNVNWPCTPPSSRSRRRAWPQRRSTALAASGEPAALSFSARFKQGWVVVELAP